MPTVMHIDLRSAALGILSSFLLLAPASTLAAEPGTLYWSCLALEKRMDDARDSFYAQYGKVRELRAQARKAHAELEAFEDRYGDSNLGDRRASDHWELKSDLDTIKRRLQSAESEMNNLLDSFRSWKGHFHESLDCTRLEAF